MVEGGDCVLHIHPFFLEMIIIYKNSANTCIFTLDEKQTTITHDWVFEFTHENTGEVKTFTTTDISLYPHYNEFIITETTSENLFNGEVELEIGDYTYKIYEMAVSSPVNLDVTNALALCETGRVKVIDQLATETSYFTDDEIKSNGEFNEE